MYLYYMKRTIILTENDIRNIVFECVYEYYKQNSINEGKTAKLLTALGLTAGSIAGINYTPSNMHKQDKIQQVQNISGTTKNNDADTINYNDINLNKGYYPSDDLIEFIKSYETFHDGWQDDGTGILTTGWGFKMTPELKKRFPKGMHRDKNGNTPEADAYLKEYIDKNIGLFRKYTPNIDRLPQEYADALFDVFYNVGPNVYKNSPNLQHALKNFDLPQIANNLRYGKLKGHKLRSADRKNILKGNYKRTQ